jgi:hypothetical protein
MKKLRGPRAIASGSKTRSSKSGGTTAQIDHFMFQMDVGYPSAEDEVRIAARTAGARALPRSSVPSSSGWW